MVWGKSAWDYDDEIAGPLMWSAEHVVTNEEDFWLDFPNSPTATNYNYKLYV